LRGLPSHPRGLSHACPRSDDQPVPKPPREQSPGNLMSVRRPPPDRDRGTNGRKARPPAAMSRACISIESHGALGRNWRDRRHSHQHGAPYGRMKPSQMVTGKRMNLKKHLPFRISERIIPASDPPCSLNRTYSQKSILRRKADTLFRGPRREKVAPDGAACSEPLW
jgi:hypothetical protein